MITIDKNSSTTRPRNEDTNSVGVWVLGAVATVTKCIITATVTTFASSDFGEEAHQDSWPLAKRVNAYFLDEYGRRAAFGERQQRANVIQER